MSMISEQVNKIRKVEKCIYLATDKEVADDISSTLKQAADTIESLSANLAVANMERPDRHYGSGKIKLIDLKDVISEDSDVGITAEGYDDLPIVDTWGNWINGGFKTLDVEVTRISSCAYILLEPKVDGDQKS